MRRDFTLDDGAVGYACFNDETGECYQFVIFFHDIHYPNWRFPVAYGGTEFQEYMLRARIDYLWKTPYVAE